MNSAKYLSAVCGVDHEHNSLVGISVSREVIGVVSLNCGVTRTHTWKTFPEEYI
jgi:hypothetical protein